MRASGAPDYLPLRVSGVCVIAASAARRIRIATCALASSVGSRRQNGGLSTEARLIVDTCAYAAN